MKNKYYVEAPRKVAALYYAWEFGLKRANSMMKKAGTTKRGRIIIDLSIFNLKNKKSEWINAVSRIREAVAFQEGRLGRDMTAGGGCVALREAA